MVQACHALLWVAKKQQGKWLAAKLRMHNDATDNTNWVTGQIAGQCHALLVVAKKQQGKWLAVELRMHNDAKDNTNWVTGQITGQSKRKA